jgi:hypothetical protein
LVRGHAVAGICLLRLGHARPSWAPAATGLRSENAAHRIAVEWDGPRGAERGVYIPRRDTDSRLNAWAGGRVFPGEHGRADFEVRETPHELRVGFATRDGDVRATVDVELVTPSEPVKPAERSELVGLAQPVGPGEQPGGLSEEASEVLGSELFDGLADASRFFRAGSKGYSATRSGDHLDGMELSADAWRVEACRVRGVTSSYFDDPDRFPPGTVNLDCALVMRNVPVRWLALPAMAVRAAGQPVC